MHASGAVSPPPSEGLSLDEE